MKLLVLADLHTEFAGFNLPDTEADVVVLAGDIAVGLAGVRGAMAASERLGKPVVCVPGNHEYYYNEKILGDAVHDEDVDGIDEVVRRMKDLAAGSLVSVLNNDELRVGETRILGATLWTDFALFGLERRELTMAHSAAMVNDFRGLIKYRGRHFLPQDAAEKHFESLQWLGEKFTEDFSGKTVVVTHHAPSGSSLSPAFEFQPMSAAFASDLEDFIRASPSSVWLHGHTHHCVQYEVGGTRVVSNQRGYPDEENQFDPRLVVEV